MAKAGQIVHSWVELAAVYLASGDAVLAEAGMSVAASVLLLHSFDRGKVVGRRSCWVALGLAVVGTSLEVVVVLVVVGIGFDHDLAWPFGVLGVVVAWLM